MVDSTTSAGSSISVKVFNTDCIIGDVRRVTVVWFCSLPLLTARS